MKENRLTWILLLLLPIATVFQLHAQQADADRKLFEEIKAKAEKGEAAAQSDLGFCYDQGKGVAKDTVQAVKWYRKAADQGDAPAQSMCGYCYLNGHGVPKDAVEAVSWLRKAADQGYSKAQCILGFCYERGKGVKIDLHEAAKWLRKAAEQGHPMANTHSVLIITAAMV